MKGGAGEGKGGMYAVCEDGRGDLVRGGAVAGKRLFEGEKDPTRCGIGGFI